MRSVLIIGILAAMIQQVTSAPCWSTSFPYENSAGLECPANRARAHLDDASNPTTYNDNSDFQSLCCLTEEISVNCDAPTADGISKTCANNFTQVLHLAPGSPTTYKGSGNNIDSNYAKNCCLPCESGAVGLKHIAYVRSDSSCSSFYLDDLPRLGTAVLHSDPDVFSSCVYNQN